MKCNYLSSALVASWFEAGRLKHSFASRLNVFSQIDWAIEDQVENWTFMARLCDEQAFSPLDDAILIGSPLALVLYITVVLIVMRWQREVVSNGKETSCPPYIASKTRIRNCASQAPPPQQTECLPTTQLSYQAFSEQIKNLNSIAGPYNEQFSPFDTTAGIGPPMALAIYIFVVLIAML